MHIRDFQLLKLILLLLTIVGSSNVAAQSIADTVLQMPDIVVSASRSQHFSNNIKTEVFTSKELNDYTGEPLSSFFSNNTALNIKAYGIGGGLANVTLRGTSSNHVQVNWNGFPINSVTLGSCDFSMIPAGGFDQVSVIYGASGALYGNGTFGGAINLDNNLAPEKALKGSAQLGYQSLKTLSGGGSFLAGNNKVAWKINFWGADSYNEFTYFDYIKQCRRKQTDGDWNDAGFIQDAVVKLSAASTLEAGLWYQVKAYNIPSHIGSTSYAFQKDSTLKIFVAYKTHHYRWGLQLKTAMFNDEENYWQKTSSNSSVNSIASRIAARQWYSDANFRYYLRPHLSIDAGVTCTYISADVSAYGDIKKENGLAAFTGIKYENHRFSWQAVVRKEWNNNFNSNILPSLGMTWKVVPDNWTLRADISKKFRKPTFNDLYWVPGGNQDLKPEMGYSIEAGSSGYILKNENTKISTDLSIYWSQIKDMIVWRPASTYWVAKNYQQVHSAGMDISFLFDTQGKHWEYSSSLKITLNRSMVKTGTSDDEEVMLYSPRVITSWENKICIGIIDFTVWHHFTADRFYDENSLLEPYQTIDVQTGVRIPLGKGKLGVHALVNNLTNTSYELIRLYPMPGRYWSVKISYSF